MTKRGWELGDDAFLMLALLAVASAVAFMGPGGVTAPARRCVTAQAPRTMRPVAGVQLNPNEQMDIRKELSDLKTRLLSVEQSTETRAVNTNRTNAMAKTNLKENQLVNYDDVSRSPLPSPMPRARLATPDPRPPTSDPRPPTPDPRSPPFPALRAVNVNVNVACGRRIRPL